LGRRTKTPVNIWERRRLRAARRSPAACLVGSSDRCARGQKMPRTRLGIRRVSVMRRTAARTQVYTSLAVGHQKPGEIHLAEMRH
jgi:hypothetical protein